MPDRLTPALKWGLITLFWLGWSAACTSFSYSWHLTVGRPRAWIQLAPLFFSGYTVWAVFTPVAVWLAKRFPIESGRWLKSIACHLAITPFVLLCHGLINTMFDPWIWPEMIKQEPFLHVYKRGILMSGTDDIFIYWSIVLVVQGLLYYRRYRDRELKTSVLESQLAKAQLQALKVQLHPHFLFNTLNSITELMHQDIRGAERMITRLSDLLRLTLENIGTQEVTLRDEVEFAKGYLEIEQTRFQDRLRVEYDIAPDTLDARVPNLLLQPVVENAVRHGISKTSRPGLIRIKAERLGDRVILQICDNGPGLKTNGQSPAAHFGIGLSTTRTRLEVLYGQGNHLLSVENRYDGGVETRMEIPYQSNAVEEVVPEALTIRPDPRPILQGVRT
jgi:two-component system, LytTR family, sensor kinase